MKKMLTLLLTFSIVQYGLIFGQIFGGGTFFTSALAETDVEEFELSSMTLEQLNQLKSASITHLTTLEKRLSLMPQRTSLKRPLPIGALLFRGHGLTINTPRIGIHTRLLRTSTTTMPAAQR